MKPTINHIYLYDDPDSQGLNVDYLAQWLAAQFPQAPVQVRSDYLTHQLARFPDDQRETLVEKLCAQLAGAEVHDLVRPEDRNKLPPLPPEERGLDVVYEAVALQTVLRLLLEPTERKLSHLHVMFTSNYLGTWRQGEVQLRLQAAVLGVVNIISTSGLVEALELPREYHFMRQQLAVLGVEEDVDQLFADRTLGYGDPRLNEVCKGYLMQAAFYRLTGDMGCDDPACRLHLSSTHADTLCTQVLGRPGLCARHKQELTALGAHPE